MKDLTYREFLDLVLQSNGIFSYRCFGKLGVCSPEIYIARNWGSLERIQSAVKSW